MGTAMGQICIYPTKSKVSPKGKLHEPGGKNHKQDNGGNQQNSCLTKIFVIVYSLDATFTFSLKTTYFLLLRISI